jgi:hypothetical protein
MKIKVYVIDFETPRWMRRVVAFVAPFVLVAGAVTVVVAAPQQWKTNDPLTAADLNKLSVFVGPTGARYSVGATKFCGVSTSPSTGAFTFTSAAGPLKGYLAAKASCEASAQCGTSSTAHMCSSEELTRSSQAGVVVASGWYTPGVGSYVNQGGVEFVLQDCLGWSSLDPAKLGSIWSTSGPQGTPTWDRCSVSYPILCCD